MWLLNNGVKGVRHMLVHTEFYYIEFSARAKGVHFQQTA